MSPAAAERVELTESEVVCLPSASDGDPTFTAYSRGERWNGFACPRFTRLEADRVAETIREAPGPESLVYDGEIDAYIYRSPEQDTRHVFEGQPATLPDGAEVTVYAIGARSWCWQLPQAG